MEMPKVLVEKLEIVETNHPDDVISDIVAFQMVKITSNHSWFNYSEYHDTRIYKDGRQTIIDGDGWFPAGTDISTIN